MPERYLVKKFRFCVGGSLRPEGPSHCCVFSDVGLSRRRGESVVIYIQEHAQKVPRTILVCSTRRGFERPPRLLGSFQNLPRQLPEIPKSFRRLPKAFVRACKWLPGFSGNPHKTRNGAFLYEALRAFHGPQNEAFLKANFPFQGGSEFWRRGTIGSWEASRASRAGF